MVYVDCDQLAQNNRTTSGVDSTLEHENQQGCTESVSLCLLNVTYSKVVLSLVLPQNEVLKQVVSPKMDKRENG